MKIILGLDVSSANIGWCYLHHPVMWIEDSGTIKLTKKKKHESGRLIEAMEEIQALAFRVDEVVIEDVPNMINMKSVNTLKVLSMYKAAATMGANSANKEVFYMLPKTVRAQLGGKPGWKKDRFHKHLKETLPQYFKDVDGADTIDAIALAVAFTKYR